MQIVEATREHLPAWLALRRQLWPVADEQHVEEMEAILASPYMTAFLLLAEDGEPLGFVEGALYLDAHRKYGYVEGWYLIPERRGEGLGSRLLAALEQWILHHSIALVLSDTDPEAYPASTRAHRSNGYRELMTIRVFVKRMGDDGGAA